MRRNLQAVSKQRQGVNTPKGLLLPKGWRIKAVEILKNQGYTVTPQTITDLLRGHVKNLELLEKVVAVQQEISKEHVKAEKRRKALISG